MQSRRTFLKSVAAAGALGGAVGAVNPINHVVVVCMENRSFDHFLGWMPTVNPNVIGSQNFVYPTAGGSQATWYLGSDTMGCPYKDPDHSWSGARTEYDGGKCDGWLLNTAKINSPSDITRSPICRFSAMPRPIGPSAITTLPRSWGRHIPTGSTSIRLQPTAPPIR